MVADDVKPGQGGATSLIVYACAMNVVGVGGVVVIGQAGGNKKAVERGGLIRAAACLLYTSPSPRDRTRSRMPSSA